MSSSGKFGASASDTPKFVARYIEDFIDLVENVPNDLSRKITRVHELQVDYESLLSRLESNLTRFSRKATASSDNQQINDLKLLLAIQNNLAKMQEISDNKLAMVQEALDQLDRKSHELDLDFRLITAATSDSTSKETTKNTSSTKDKKQSPEPTYCICNQVSFGDMICCDNDACEIEWFHFQCVSLASKPKGKWYCPNCRGDRSNQPKK